MYFYEIKTKEPARIPLSFSNLKYCIRKRCFVVAKIKEVCEKSYSFLLFLNETVFGTLIDLKYLKQQDFLCVKKTKRTKTLVYHYIVVPFKLMYKNT